MRRILVLCLLLSLAAGPALAASAEEEATRQITFARGELADGRFDRALRSAESALTLAPALYEAMVVKALAYEGLGRTDLALALLAAYAELAPRGPALAEVQAARERIEAGHRLGARRPRERRTPTAVEQEVLATLDPDVYRRRLVAALSAGQCAAARAAAKELLGARPDEAAGYRLLGDAARCDGDSREAVIAYRRFGELGGSDPAVDSMIQGLQGMLARLVVQVALPEDAGVPRMRLLLGDEELTPRSLPDGSWRFEDLPAGVELLLLLEGRGLRDLERGVEPLGVGAERAITVEPEWVGTGRLTLGDRPCKGCLVLAWIEGVENELGPGQSVEVTAGLVPIEVSNAHGTSEVPVTVEPGDEVTFDPVSWMPSELTLIGVPAGSRVTVRIRGFEGAELRRDLELPVGAGELDTDAGVRVPSPQRIRSLVGGEGVVVVEHPVLGTGEARLVLEPGAVNATTFNLRTMPGTPAARTAFEAWRLEVQQARRKAATRPLPTAILAIGSGVAAAVLLGLGGGASADAATLGRDYETSLATETADQISDRYDAWQGRELEATRLLAAGGISGGVAAIGGTLTVVLAATGEKPPRLEDWRLEVK